MFHHVKSVVALPDFTVHLEYVDGDIIDVDIAPLIAQGGVFEALHDPRVFAQVRLGENGRYVEWPNGVDLCADALHEKAGLAVC